VLSTPGSLLRALQSALSFLTDKVALPWVATLALGDAQSLLILCPLQSENSSYSGQDRNENL
jgi:hypothetical protein